MDLPTLYYPDSVEDLLTRETVGKFMLGFTVGMERMAVALEDRTRRYDLFGNPQDYWCKFCRAFRRKYGFEDECHKWDEYVAKVLLGDLPGKPGERESFRKPFPCHAGMIDFAELIRLGGKPFAVLHGGQIVPGTVTWWKDVDARLEKYIPDGNARTELRHLAERDRSARDKGWKVGKLHQQFVAFARELETLLNKLYSERRRASEESLLHALASRLLEIDLTDWQDWWDKFGELIAAVKTVAGLDKVGWFLGSVEKRFHLRDQIGTRVGWRGAELRVGPFWEAIRHKPGLIAGTGWQKHFSEALALDQDSFCMTFPAVVSQGSPPRDLPAILVVTGNQRDAEHIRDFLQRLGEEIKRAFIFASNAMESRKATEEAGKLGAYTGHDMKSPLHTAMHEAAAIRYHLVRTEKLDQPLEKKVTKLQYALSVAKKKATRLEQMPIKEIVVECEFEEKDIIRFIDRSISFANSLDPDRDVTVEWIERPSDPVIARVDEDYFNTCLDAVMDNAVKYSFSRTQVRVWGQARENRFELLVKNLGVGIPPDKLFTIFEFHERAVVKDPKVAKPREGSGLGLPFSRRIITAHGGTISVDSKPSKPLPPDKEDDFVNHLVVARIVIPIKKGIAHGERGT
ncbi:MAG: PocR ligand-binding domain-containing protein [Planctomycetes bacterium]|nr:PocR ligand-binding domain-containing protein [Planctomycetota bacterium]MBL7043422.1 PocR ligand-binding domain-containing protein [Pirellulaceae bacterium]